MLQAGVSFARTVVGTPYYLSPEVCQAKPYNSKSDAWSCGVLLYECCTRRHPFDANSQVGSAQQVQKVQRHAAAERKGQARQGQAPSEGRLSLPCPAVIPLPQDPAGPLRTHHRLLSRPGGCSAALPHPVSCAAPLGVRPAGPACGPCQSSAAGHRAAAPAGAGTGGRACTAGAGRPPGAGCWRRKGATDCSRAAGVVPGGGSWRRPGWQPTKAGRGQEREAICRWRRR